MAEKYLNYTGLNYYHNRLETLFADKDEFDTLADEVAEIIAEGGEPNTIESISVNGTAVQPDANKNVALTIPTATSDLTNDGDGDSPFATEDYVDQNGGKIDSISIDGTPQTIDANKNVALDLSNYALASSVPTKVSDLQNDSGFITNTVNNLTNYYTKSETYTQTEVDNLISQLAGLDIEVVQTLPTQDISTHTIYLVPKSSAGTQNVYDEYIYTNNAWELIGSTEVDLSNYWTSQSGQTNSLIAITTAEIDAIIAGA